MAADKGHNLASTLHGIEQLLSGQQPSTDPALSDRLSDDILSRLVSVGKRAEALLHGRCQLEDGGGHGAGAPERGGCHRPAKRARVRLRTFNAQPKQELFSLQSIPATLEEVVGCPWCRRPLTVEEVMTEKEHEERPTKYAYVSVLYGDKREYFLGAVVLAHSLRNSSIDRVLLVTEDVPSQYRPILKQLYSEVVTVEYLSIWRHVQSSLFQNPKKTRFGDVFTKLRVLGLEQYERVLFLDLDTLVVDHVKLERVFTEVRAPAALARGEAGLNYGLRHGDKIPYRLFWEGYERKVWPKTATSELYVEEMLSSQQASGINAGVMLLAPDRRLLDHIIAECKDWQHPQHYPTYMPEQEYLGRLLGCVHFPGCCTGWSHLSPAYNFEVDKNLRIPFDFSSEHAQLSTDHAAVVLHYSGKQCKPWDFLGELDVCETELLETRLELRLRKDWGEGESSTTRIAGNVAVWLRAFASLERGLSPQVKPVLRLEPSVEASPDCGVPAHV